MNIKNNIEELFNSDVSNYQISKDTKISQMTLSKYATGKSELGNMTLDNALKLNDYYTKNKEMLIMLSILNDIKKNYKVDGENEKFMNYYESAAEIKEEIDQDIFEEVFLNGYVQKPDSINELNYPVITFDNSNSVEGKLFEANEKDDILDEAKEYFEKK